MVQVKNNLILVTGSSGYVASSLLPLLRKVAPVVGVDKVPSRHTDILADIGNYEFNFENVIGKSLCLINLASARFDFGAVAKDYYEMNVNAQKSFLNNIQSSMINKFIHVSSVAAIDGKKLEYSDNLNCDDAYRVTKYLQEEIIRIWCQKNNVDLVILYPSAIFSAEHRSDTNIGKLQKLARIIPFVPLIDVKKSLTFLPEFSKFILTIVTGEIPTGNFMTVERPILTVTEMVTILSGKSLMVIRIPFLKQLLMLLGWGLYLIGGFGRIDLKLTPNRVVKLFSDTSYDDLVGLDIDVDTYQIHSATQLASILRQFNLREC